MYRTHFGLLEEPFGITPDTNFVIPTKCYQEALNTLTIAVRNGAGFSKITGEVGTGKTLLCRKFLASLGPEYVTAYIHNPYLEPQTLLLALADELAIPLPGAEDNNQHHLLKVLAQALTDIALQGKRAVLCIDEAQAMPIVSMEALRLLTNLETEKNKLLQVVLFGQPELDEKLAQDSVRQLLQRIIFQYHLRPLAYDEIGHYLAHRLSVAGYQGEPLFPPQVVQILHRTTKGIPRLVNIVAHKSLLVAQRENSHQVKKRHLLAAVIDTPAAKQPFLQIATVIRYTLRDWDIATMRLVKQGLVAISLLITVITAVTLGTNKPSEVTAIPPSMVQKQHIAAPPPLASPQLAPSVPPVVQANTSAATPITPPPAQPQLAPPAPPVAIANTSTITPVVPSAPLQLAPSVLPVVQANTSTSTPVTPPSAQPQLSPSVSSVATTNTRTITPIVPSAPPKLAPPVPPVVRANTSAATPLAPPRIPLGKKTTQKENSKPNEAENHKKPTVTATESRPHAPQPIVAHAPNASKPQHQTATAPGEPENTEPLSDTRAGTFSKSLAMPRHANDEYATALTALQQGRFEEAKESLAQVVASNPFHRNARLALANLALERGDETGSEQILREGLQLDPKSATLAFPLARIVVAQGNTRDGLEILRGALPSAGDDPHYHAFVGALEQRTGNHNGAILQYHAALRKHPNNAVWLMGLGISLAAEHKDDEARQVFRIALDSHNLSAELHAYVEQQLRTLAHNTTPKDTNNNRAHPDEANNNNTHADEGNDNQLPSAE